MLPDSRMYKNKVEFYTNYQIDIYEMLEDDVLYIN